MGAKYSGCIQAHFRFDDYLSTSEAEPKWSKSFFFRRNKSSHATQHYQDIIIDGGEDQGCGENEGRDVGGQASSDWGCCLPTFSLLLHIIAWHPLVLHGIADTACDRGCVRGAKKPITNPRSIKDFAITKHAFRKAGPGALGEFRPGVRPTNLLIVFFGGWQLFVTDYGNVAKVYKLHLDLNITTFPFCYCSFNLE